MSSSKTAGVNGGWGRLGPPRQLAEESPVGGGPVGARRRWRPGLVALGVAGAIACAGGVAWTVGSAGHRVPVLAVVRPVGAGEVIGAGDVGVVRLGVDDATQIVPARERAGVVGRRAVVPLLAGELLAPGQVGEVAEFPPQGRALVVVGVEAGMWPAGLAAGQRIAVVPGVPPGGRAATEADAKAPDPVLGVVSAVSRSDAASGKGAVTVLVDAAAVRRAAQMSDPRIAVLGESVKEVS
ncbi:SAF domain-containing protein [Streptomyces sp. NPDC006703]|uniref:SAF domain-containing protein n=1 Tax=Streptomyces sp. NPDC006703 TaxID=3364759 RepID=UPI0036C8518C